MGNRLHISRGIEVLIKKAAVDPDFRELLLAERAKAAETIDLKLTPAEKAMLASIPADLLGKVIDQTHVPSWARRIFLGSAAAAMLIAVSVTLQMDLNDRNLTGPVADLPIPTGYQEQPIFTEPQDQGVQLCKGITADRPETSPYQITLGIQPDRPPRRAIDLLFDQAAQDPEFRASLIERRGEAAKTIGIELNDEEIGFLEKIPHGQLEGFIKLIPGYVEKTSPALKSAADATTTTTMPKSGGGTHE